MRIFDGYSRKFQVQKLFYRRISAALSQRQNNPVCSFSRSDLLHVCDGTDDSGIDQRFANIFPGFIQEAYDLELQLRPTDNLPNQVNARSSRPQNQNSLRLLNSKRFIFQKDAPTKNQQENDRNGENKNPPAQAVIGIDEIQNCQRHTGGPQGLQQAH